MNNSNYSNTYPQKSGGGYPNRVPNFQTSSVNDPNTVDGLKDFDPVEIGKTFVDRVGVGAFKTSQLRQILSGAAIVKNRIDRESVASEKLSVEIQNEISYLKLKLIYQLGRNEGLKKAFEGGKGVNLPGIIGNIGDSKEKFNRFYRLLESIVAYRRFLGQDN